MSAFAKRAFRSQNSVLDAHGERRHIEHRRGDGRKRSRLDGRALRLEAGGNPASTTTAGAVDGVGLAWVGPPIADQKAATALDFVADYLFREQTGVVSRVLDRADSDALVVGQFITLHDPGVMVVTIGGSNEKQTEKRVLEALGALQQPLDAQTFNAAREAFLYHVATDTQTPQERADNLGWYTRRRRTRLRARHRRAEPTRSRRVLSIPNMSPTSFAVTSATPWSSTSSRQRRKRSLREARSLLPGCRAGARAAFRPRAPRRVAIPAPSAGKRRRRDDRPAVRRRRDAGRGRRWSYARDSIAKR